jgi:hypothetical protein
LIKNLTTRRVYREWGEIRQAGRSILLLVTSFELIYRESTKAPLCCCSVLLVNATTKAEK